MKIENTVFNVDGMSCEHCVKAVEKAVNALAGIKSVAVNLKKKTATVEYDADKCTADNIKSAIEEQGYDVAD